ncbi:hypothetical protein B0H14DRAFT_2328481, partial [Mycena olivaceomarginata]
GHDEYGCFISTDKTVTNFDFDEQLNSIPHERGRLHLLSLSNCFPWCGYVINARDLSVSVEYSRYYGNGACNSFFSLARRPNFSPSDLNNTLTVSRGRRPGAAFKHKMLQSVSQKPPTLLWAD